MVHQVLQRFGFRYSSPKSTALPTGHSFSAPPSDESVEPSGPYPELVGCLIYLMTCTRPDLAYPLSILARYVAPGRHRPEHWEAAKRVLRYLCSTLGMGLVLGGQGPVVLTGHTDASWEHRTKHIALCYFLARELQQRGQLRLAYVATWANTGEIFTKALQPAEPRCPLSCTALPSHAAPLSSTALHCPTVTAATTAPTAAMASPTVLTFDAEGCAVDFDMWVDDLQLFLQCNSRDGWTTRDDVARLAVRSHLPPAERAHFGQYKTAQSLYDAVVTRYSSPATTALSRLMLPYLFPDLAAFATVTDLAAHLRTSDALYRADLPTEDHFLSLCPTELTVDLLEERLAAAEKSILAVGASCGDRRTPFFEGCSPVPLLPSIASAAAVDLVGTKEVGAASAPSGRRRNSNGKGSKGGGGGGGGSGGAGGGGGRGGGGGGGGTRIGGFSGGGGGGGGSGGGGGGSGSGGGGGGGGGASRGAAAQRGGFGGSQRQQQPRSCETPSAQQLRKWYARRGRSGGAGPCTYVLRTGSRRGEARGLPHTTQRCFGCLTGAWHAHFPDAVELPRWHDLLLQNVAIFDLDFDAILADLYALTDSAEGDCYLSVPPDPGIAAAALGASASATPRTGESAAPGDGKSALSGTARTEALHTFTLDSGAPRSFFRDSTTLTPLSRPVAVSLADPSGGPVLAHSSTVLPCTAAPSGLLSGLHLPSFSTKPARVCGQGHEFYFLLVVDDYSRYTTVFPFRSKGEVPEVLINWIRGARRRLSERFGSDLPVLRLQSDRGGEFSFDLLRAFCRAEGIRQTFTLPASPQQNGIAERRIGMVVDVARTSMIHAATPHFLWPFAVQYATHQINLQPRVSLPETTPTLQWAGKVGDASAFRDVTFDESVSYYRLFPYRTASLPPPPLFLAPGTPSVDPLPPQGPAPSRVSQVDPVEPVEVAVDSVWGAEPGGAESRRAEPGGAEPACAESGGALGVPSRQEALSPQQLREWYSRRCRGAAGSGAAGADGGAPVAAGGTAGASATRAAGGAAGGAAGAAGGATSAAGGAAGAAGAGAAGAAGSAPGAAGGTAGAGAAGAAGGAAGASATRAAGGATGAARGGAGAAGGAAGAAGAGAAGAAGGAAGGAAAAVATRAAGRAVGTGDPGAEGTGLLHPASPLPGPSPYSGPTRGLTECREPKSRPVLPESRSELPVRTVRAGRVSRPRPPPVPGTHSMTLRPSTASQHVPLLSPPASSLPAGPDPASDSLRAASPAVTQFLATAVTDPLFESTATSALVTELVDFAAACRLDYATSLVAESASESVCPPFIGGECALGTDVLEDKQEEFDFFAATVPHLVSMLLAHEGDPDAPDIPTPRSYAEAIEGPYSSQWQAAMDAEMASWKSRGTYVDEVPPPGANIVSGMWIFRVKRPPGSPPVFKARYVAHGFNDIVFATADTEALAHVKSKLQKRHTCTDLGELTSYLGLRITRDRAQCTITLTQSHMVQQVLQRFGFTYSLPQSTALPTGHSLSAPPSDESVEPSGPYLELMGCLMYLMTCTRPDLAYPLSILARYMAPGRHRKVHWDAAKRVLRYLCSTSGMGLVLGGRARVVLTGHADASWVDDLATQRSSQGYTFSLGSGSVSWRSTCSSSILSSSCEAEIYAGAMAAQELRWLTYLLTDLGEAPRSPPVLYVDNKAMLALCQEHRLEHRTKHIALRYFLARELQQRCQLRLAYVASEANTADVFTKALQPCDHQHFCTVLGLVPTVPHLLSS
ncbi:unnamed protein product [Closterium sp. NIES-54]